MTTITLDYLVRLGLDASANERDVKKAYARELKLINPATEPEAFAQLRSAYEASLRYVEFRTGLVPPSSSELEINTTSVPEVLGTEQEAAPAVVDADETNFVETQDPGDFQQRPRAEGEVDLANKPTELDDQKKVEPAFTVESLPDPDYQGVEHTFDLFANALAFSPSDLAAAKEALRHWLARDELMPLVAREAFEQELMAAISSRRFNARTAAVFLAAADIFDWMDARHSLLERMGYAGFHISNLLNELVALSETTQQRWLALTEEPDPRTALYRIGAAERVETTSPVLASLFFSENYVGHIDAWKAARHRAPLLLRSSHQVRELVKDSARLRGVLCLLMIPLVIGVMAAVLSHVQVKQTTQASDRCDALYASAMALGWKDLSMIQLSQMKDCTRNVPPLLCSDRSAMLDTLGLYERLNSGVGFGHFSYSFNLRINLSDGRSFGAAQPVDCSALQSFVMSSPWLDEGDEPAARQLIADVKGCDEKVTYVTISPTLKKFLSQTDAWSAPATGSSSKSGPKPVALKALLGKPSKVPFQASPLHPWPACEREFRTNLQMRMGPKEWTSAMARTNDANAGMVVMKVLQANSPNSPEVQKALADLAAANAVTAAVSAR